MPNQPYKEIPITFEKGLVTEIEESLLEAGQGSDIVNWEATPQGSLRTRNAWSATTKTGLTSPYSVRGLGSIASGTTAAGSITAPVVVQSSVWPNGVDSDMVSTKTRTLTGVTNGRVLVAIVSDASGLSPTVTAGWTERAVSTGARQYVKYYTKVASSSTEEFTYTISGAYIRAVSLHEVAYADSADPGSLWAATNDTAGTGTDSATFTQTDTEGALIFAGYTYDGGTPASGHSGTSGYSTAALDNSNPRVGVSFDDLDNLDGTARSTGATDFVYTSPSWTPPTTGWLVLQICATSSGSPTTTVSGNGLTWTKVHEHDATGTNYQDNQLWKASLESVVGTTGSITVRQTHVGAQTADAFGMVCSFIRVLGTDGTITNKVSTTGSGSGNYSCVATIDGNAWIGMGQSVNSTFTLDVGTDNWDIVYDQTTVPGWQNGPTTPGYIRFAYTATDPSDNTLGVTQTGIANSFTIDFYDIKASGNAAKHYHGPVTQNGTVIESFGYVNGKNITCKTMALTFNPPTVQPDVIDFFIVMAVATDSTTYKVYRVPRDEITSGTWELLDTVTDATSTEAWVAFSQGVGKLVWSASTMTQPRAIDLATLAQANVTDLFGKAGRTVCYHKDRMFVAGSSDAPARLYFSGIGTPTTFTTATDYLDIGGDDGDAIQDLISVEGLLLVAKTNRAYLISGSGVESFFVNELPGGTAAAGRPAVRTPYGTVLAGTDDIWVIQGGGVDPMSRPLGSGYVVTGNVSCSYGQDSVLVCDSATGHIWRANLVTGAWMEEEVTGDNASVYNLFSLNGRHYYGTNGSTSQVGGTRRLSSTRDYDKTTGDMNLVASTGKMAMQGPSVKYTPRYLFLQVRNQDPTKPNGLEVTVTTDQGTEVQGIRVSEAVQRERIDLGKFKGCEWMQITFAADSSETNGAIDVERIVLGVYTEQVR